MTESVPELVEGLPLADRYTLLNPLGSGGMADVWLARDEREQREVALKFLKPELVARPEFIELLKQEAERCRRLSHPAIVRVYGFHNEQGCVFIAMEYLPGGSLLSLKQTAWQGLLQLLLPVLDALEYAHSAGFIHRDLRAANILLDKSGRPRVTDFGVAVSLQDVQLNYSGGSLPSMSPQQLDNEPPAVT
ncbi:MAG: serine/threonine-protein kinase, partial [Gammaproteobacteria bacterium]